MHKCLRVEKRKNPALRRGCKSKPLFYCTPAACTGFSLSWCACLLPYICMSARFSVPVGDILAVRVAAILVRHARQGEAGLHCEQWELVLPEIEYRPGGG